MEHFDTEEAISNFHINHWVPLELKEYDLDQLEVTFHKFLQKETKEEFPVN